MKLLNSMGVVELDGSEQEIVFLMPFSYAHIQNLGTEDIKVSPYPNIESREDGWVICNPNNAVTVPLYQRKDRFYISGSGKINVITTDSATNPYRVAGKGGGGGGGGFTPTPEVLDFLPYPEDIYAYWDWGYGVAGISWTDMLNNNVLRCENGNSFTYGGDYLKLNNSGFDVNLNVKDVNDVIIYHVIKLSEGANQNNSRIFSDANSFTEMHLFGGVYYTLAENRSEQMYLDCSVKGMIRGDIAVFVIRNITNNTSLFSLQKEIFLATSGKKQYFTSDIYMYGSQYYYKAILLSNGDIFDNIIKDNMAALYNKYST